MLAKLALIGLVATMARSQPLESREVGNSYDDPILWSCGQPLPEKEGVKAFYYYFDRETLPDGAKTPVGEGCMLAVLTQEKEIDGKKSSVKAMNEAPIYMPICKDDSFAGMSAGEGVDGLGWFAYVKTPLPILKTSEFDLKIEESGSERADAYSLTLLGNLAQPESEGRTTFGDYWQFNVEKSELVGPKVYTQSGDEKYEVPNPYVMHAGHFNTTIKAGEQPAWC